MCGFVPIQVQGGDITYGALIWLSYSMVKVIIGQTVFLC